MKPVLPNLFGDEKKANMNTAAQSLHFYLILQAGFLLHLWPTVVTIVVHVQFFLAEIKNQHFAGAHFKFHLQINGLDHHYYPYASCCCFLWV